MSEQLGPAPEDHVVERPSGPSIATVVTGLVVLGVAAGVAVTQLTTYEIDLGLAVPVGMLVAGALLVLGALGSLARRRRL